jgi:hypothetical protein
VSSHEGGQLFLPRHSKFAAVRLRAAGPVSVVDLRRRWTEHAGACPSGLTPATTPASRRAWLPPGQGRGARAPLSALRRSEAPRRCHLLLSAAIPVFNEHPEVRSNPVRRTGMVSHPGAPSHRRRLCPVPPRGAREAKLITGRQRLVTVAGFQVSSGAAVGPHLRPWSSRPRSVWIGGPLLAAPPSRASVFFLPGSGKQAHGRPISSPRTAAMGGPWRPEPRRESNAPRYSSVRLRTPSAAESRLLRRAPGRHDPPGFATGGIASDTRSRAALRARSGFP